ncbi:MotA/TolQ/ExbB proton channel family protein [Cyanobium sp. FGCU-6]|nr:MotA/TolQ/ExbB proton channel family protein [Cyanobium sp. FGCU6]
MKGVIPGVGGLVGLLLLLASIAVLTVVFDRGRFWWQWWRRRAGRARQWRERLEAGGGGGEEQLEEWERQMVFGEAVLQAAAVLAPLLGLIGTVLGLMAVLAALGPGLTLPPGAPLAGYGRVLLATALGLIVSLIATAGLLANQAARGWQIEELRRQLRRGAQR